MYSTFGSVFLENLKLLLHYSQKVMIMKSYMDLKDEFSRTRELPSLLSLPPDLHAEETSDGVSWSAKLKWMGTF